MDEVKKVGLSMWNSFKSNLRTDILIYYFVEGFVIALVAYVLPQQRMKIDEIMTLTILIALSLFLLDIFTKTIGSSARLGTGIGIGMNLVNIAGPVSMPFL